MAGLFDEKLFFCGVNLQYNAARVARRRASADFTLFRASNLLSSQGRY
jgi:hypothetical protein